MANTTAWPVDRSQDLKTLKRGTWTPRQAKGISTEELGASGQPELACRRSTFFQVTGVKSDPQTPPHPGASHLPQAPHPKQVPLRTVHLGGLLWCGIWQRAGSSFVPVTRNRSFLPWLRAERILAVCPTTFFTWLLRRDSGEWGHLLVCWGKVGWDV